MIGREGGREGEERGMGEIPYPSHTTYVCRMAIKYKMLQKAAIGERFPFSWMVFNGWDFAIAKAVTAKRKMKDITMSFKVGKADG